MNKPLALEKERLSLHRDAVGATWRGSPLPQTMRGFFFCINIWVPFVDPANLWC